ncbi:MurR/RpiR family transcriptional regulator [Collinsella sp. AGMB00827]|uniref:MurR/RpiR family transcriptional regulator n=1 Tax=Collinsella ureilytica TaxID=2869515 RepID=A0ABS7MK15_9ACTN|nr:MurR/RpiR family transcriptional regulator [Collinsella urealyticum]MBY4797712.1 MurR/RpiR family transcriptional regulator [Collinsella urealyticum]
MGTKGSVINVICSLYDRFSESERQIADFVLANQAEVLSMTTREIAAASTTSAPTVSRFVRTLGYSSFAEMRAMMKLEDEDIPGGASAGAISIAEPRAAMETVLTAKVRELYDTLSLIDEQTLVGAVELIERAHSIEFAAVGNSIPAALSASFLLAQLGIRSSCAPTTEAMMLSTLAMRDEDLLIFISKSGHSKRLSTMMDNAIAAKTPTIVITNIPDSPLAQRATCVLHAATRDRMLNSELPFSHNSINYIIEVLFLLLCSKAADFDAHSGAMWRALGDDKGVEHEVF